MTDSDVKSDLANLASGSVNVGLRLECLETCRPNVGPVGLPKMVASEIIISFFFVGILIHFYYFLHHSPFSNPRI